LSTFRVVACSRSYARRKRCFAVAEPEKLVEADAPEVCVMFRSW
jgi:hypothetical protein